MKDPTFEKGSWLQKYIQFSRKLRRFPDNDAAGVGMYALMLVAKKHVVEHDLGSVNMQGKK